MSDLQVPQSMKIYNRFKEKILKVAEKNMFEKSSIYFEFQEKKDGKRVDELIFIIKTKAKAKVLKAEELRLFEPELSKEQKELDKFIGSKIGGHIIRGFRVVESDIYVETDVGDYRFLNIETLKKQIQRN